MGFLDVVASGLGDCGRSAAKHELKKVSQVDTLLLLLASPMASPMVAAGFQQSGWYTTCNGSYYPSKVWADVPFTSTRQFPRCAAVHAWSTKLTAVPAQSSDTGDVVRTACVLTQKSRMLITTALLC